MTTEISPGQPAPRFTLQDPDGALVTLDDLLVEPTWLHLIFLRHLG